MWGPSLAHALPEAARSFAEAGVLERCLVHDLVVELSYVEEAASARCLVHDQQEVEMPLAAVAAAGSERCLVHDLVVELSYAEEAALARCLVHDRQEVERLLVVVVAVASVPHLVHDLEAVASPLGAVAAAASARCLVRDQQEVETRASLAAASALLLSAAEQVVATLVWRQEAAWPDDTWLEASRAEQQEVVLVCSLVSREVALASRSAGSIGLERTRPDRHHYECGARPRRTLSSAAFPNVL